MKKTLFQKLTEPEKIRPEIERIFSVWNVQFYKNITKELGGYDTFFYLDPGQEHYKLLAWISHEFSKQTLLDIGSNQGASALALSHNPTNKIQSFDVTKFPGVDIVNQCENVTFYIDSILEMKFDPLLLDSPFILVDTMHMGDFEAAFDRKLRKIGYKGIVMWDDIHLNREMREFWNNLPEPKTDITSIGHVTGTGVTLYV